MPLSRINSASIANSAISAADIADGTITAAKIISVANTQLTGNIVSSQIAPSVTLYGNPTVTSGNLTVGGSTSLGTASASGNTTMYQAPGSSFLIMNVNGTLAGARRNWAISPEYDAAGGLSFSVGASEGAAPSTPRLIIKQQGALVLSNGSTSVDGTGITFPATQNASSDANTLDDYEEGTFTPTFTASGSIASFTYVVQLGSYVKIGKTVYFALNVQISSLAGGSSGNARISNLPFTASITSTYGAVSIAYAYVVGGTQPNGAMVRNGTTNIELFSNSGGGVSSIGFGSLSALDWYIGGTYTV
jgi:hypothetical protein